MPAIRDGCSTTLVGVTVTNPPLKLAPLEPARSVRLAQVVVEPVADMPFVPLLLGGASLRRKRWPGDRFRLRVLLPPFGLLLVALSLEDAPQPLHGDSEPFLGRLLSTLLLVLLAQLVDHDEPPVPLVAWLAWQPQ